MKSRGIVLHTLRYTDEQLIADVLTEQQGCVTMMVRISRSKRAAVRHSLFQPLAILDLEWTHRPRANMQRPQSVQVAEPFASLPYDPIKLSIALFVAEVLHHAVRVEQMDEDLYRYVEKSVLWLDASTRGYSNFHLLFLLRLTHFLGFLPNVVQAEVGSYFDLRSSCFVLQQPDHPDFLLPAEAQLLPKLLRMRYDTMRFFRFSGADRSRLLEAINTYYRLHLPNFPELKSLAVFRELFS